MRLITQTQTDAGVTYTFTWVSHATDSYLRSTVSSAPGVISTDAVFYESDLGCTRFTVDPAQQAEFEALVNEQEPSQYIRV